MSSKLESIAIVISTFNSFITHELLDSVKTAFSKSAYQNAELQLFWVPGAFEIPQIAAKCVQSGRFLGVMCLGAVIRGETPHFDYICQESARGLMTLSLSSDIPIVNGILTTNTMEQAIARASKTDLNKGEEFVETFVTMRTILDSPF